MIDWQDRGIILNARAFGDTDALVSVLTASRGRVAGLVKGGASRKRQADFQPGTLGHVAWRARLEDQLGSLTFEVTRAYPNFHLDDRPRLTALAAFATLVHQTMAERAPVPDLFAAYETWLQHLDQDFWALVYVRLELGLLTAQGFSADLQTCALGGDAQQLSHVSPKTGRAVSQALAAPYAHKLLPLPAFLGGVQDLGAKELTAGLKLTGTLLARHAFAPLNRDLPDVRRRLVDVLSIPSSKP